MISGIHSNLNFPLLKKVSTVVTAVEKLPLRIRAPAF